MRDETRNRGPDGALSRRQILGAGAAAILVPGWLLGCGDGSSTSGGTSSGGTPARGTDAEIDQLHWSYVSELASLDIAASLSAGGVGIMSLAFEGLLTISDDLKLQSLLATSWNQEGLDRYVFELRDGVTFWDGSPLTIDDVAFSFSRHLDPKGGSLLSTYFGNVAEVSATGERQLTISMNRPDPTLPYVLPYVHVIPERFATRAGKKFGAPGSEVRVMATGAYRVTAFTGDSVELERNESYWGGRPLVRRASLRAIPNAETNRLALSSGEIDGTHEFPLQQAKQWDRLNGVETMYATGLGVSMLAFDLTTSPWDDIHVRKAVAHAADREGYIKAFYGGRARLADALPSPPQWADLITEKERLAIYESLPRYPFDLDRARKELAQSRYPDGFEAEVIFPNVTPELGKVLVSLSESLRKLGIDLKAREQPVNAWSEHITAHKDLGLNVLGLGADYADPVNFLLFVLPSKNARPSQYNIANFKNDSVDRLLVEQAKTKDKAERVKVLTEVLRIVAEELPYLPLWWEDSSAAVRDQYVFEGFHSLYYQQNWLAKVKVRA